MGAVLGITIQALVFVSLDRHAREQVESFRTHALSLPEADATAVSLMLWATQLVVAGLGGLSQVIWPFKGDDPTEGETGERDEAPPA